MEKALSKATRVGLKRIAAVMAGKCDVCGWTPECTCWGCVGQHEYPDPMYIFCAVCKTFTTSYHWPPGKFTEGPRAPQK